MNIFVCDICNYTTKKQGNYNRHLDSKKHTYKVTHDTSNKYLQKTEEKYDFSKLLQTPQNSQKLPKSPKSIEILSESNYVCDSCGGKFARINNLTRHYKTCPKAHNETQILKLKLEQYEKSATQKEEFFNRELSHYKEEASYYKNLLNEAGGLVKKSVSALTYVVGNYDNAPCIQMIDVDNIEEFEKNNKKLAEDILSAYKHKTLSKYLGDFILSVYKKKIPHDQSIWNTDTSRLTYLIKELMLNESSNWVVDKQGIKTKTYLIDPLVGYLRKILENYQNINPFLNCRPGSAEMDIGLENNKKILELIIDIDDGVIGKDILKYISPYLCFNDKLLK